MTEATPTTSKASLEHDTNKIYTKQTMSDVEFSEIYDVDGLEDEIVEISSFEYEDTIKSANQSSFGTQRCGGYALLLPGGKTAVGKYPYLQYEGDMPWEVRIRKGMVYIISEQCTGIAPDSSTACDPCQSLQNSKALERINVRMANSASDYTPLQYLGFDDLRAKIHRKNERIEYLRLMGLNQAKKLLRRAAALDDQKRLLMAIASSNVQRVDRVLSVGLRQKKGAQGLLAQVFAAAKGFYRPQGYSKEEDMRALLIWRLAGNRVAEINHRAQSAPSVSYLRTRSQIPSLIASPAMPTVAEVTANTSSTLAPIADILESRLGASEPGGNRPRRHAVLMFDEIHTEKRFRHCPTTNKFVGGCREHAGSVSLDFVNEGDLEELFRAVDDERVHCAGEVRIRVSLSHVDIDIHPFYF